ncbi:hypothetical protein SAMN04490200_5787 [Pseudomonas proteolytica]|nr:hypothetical protein SAMN04490200_5787 [Pseudomonas proteolytica]
MASLEIDQLQQHSQLGAMGVVEPKTKKPRQMPRLNELLIAKNLPSGRTYKAKNLIEYSY